jgi:hypothetical protein
MKKLFFLVVWLIVGFACSRKANENSKPIQNLFIFMKSSEH